MYTHRFRFLRNNIVGQSISMLLCYIQKEKEKKKKFAKLGEKSDFIKKKTEQGNTRKGKLK